MKEINFRLVTKNHQGKLVSYQNTRTDYVEMEVDKKMKHFLDIVFLEDKIILQNEFVSAQLQAYDTEEDAKKETNALDEECEISELNDRGNSEANTLLIVVPSERRLNGVVKRRD